jgi:hypothetical protein
MVRKCCDWSINWPRSRQCTFSEDKSSKNMCKRQHLVHNALLRAWCGTAASERVGLFGCKGNSLLQVRVVVCFPNLYCSSPREIRTARKKKTVCCRNRTSDGSKDAPPKEFWSSLSLSFNPEKDPHQYMKTTYSKAKQLQLFTRAAIAAAPIDTSVIHTFKSTRSDSADDKRLDDYGGVAFLAV